MKKRITSILLVMLFVLPSLFIAVPAQAELVWFCTWFPNPYPPYNGLIEICFWLDIP